MNFLRIQNPDDFPARLKGGVVAIGNFDGVHRGHQSVLCAAVNIAKANHVPAAVLTFEPHPRTFFKPDSPVFRLTDAKTKADIFAEIGFDCVIEHPFDVPFSTMLARDFVQKTLCNLLDVSHVVTGYDFHFGKGREGSPQFLIQAGETLGFSATIVAAFNDEGGEIVSSSRIRQCLAKGNISETNALLGFVWRTSGTVITGQQLGRTLGYPTANITLPPETTLAHGIYAARIALEDGSLRDGVASYGRRPTFDNGEPLLETCLFEYDGDLYGQQITVFLHCWLRSEKKFDSVKTLIQQMDCDSTQAKNYLASLSSQQGLWPIL